MIDVFLLLFKGLGASLSCSKVRGDNAYYSVKISNKDIYISIQMTEDQRNQLIEVLQNPLNG